MLDNVFQYQGYDSVNERDVFTYEDSIEEVKFFDINGAVALNSETDTGEAAIQTFWLFNPNTTTPSGNPNNTAFLLRDKPTVYSDAIDSILTASDIDGILPFEPSPSGAIYSITSEKKSPPSDSPRALRAMTHDEKVRASSNQAAPLWLRPGPVNPPLNRYKELLYAPLINLRWVGMMKKPYKALEGTCLTTLPPTFLIGEIRTL